MHQGLHGLNCAGPKEETSTKKSFSLLAQPVTIFVYGPARLGLIFSEWNKNTDNYHVVSINFLGIIKYNKHVNYTIMLLIQLKMIFIDKFSQKRYLCNLK
jgi:hypothetical protein